MEIMPDPVLDQYWATLSWVLSDSALTARDKALVAFGAASATHCGYLNSLPHSAVGAERRE